MPITSDARHATRTFEPVTLARLESAAWIGYYRREWFRVLAASVGLVRCGFAMSWPKTLRGARPTPPGDAAIPAAHVPQPQISRCLTSMTLGPSSPTQITDA
jgi:hypothetical protein